MRTRRRFVPARTLVPAPGAPWLVTFHWSSTSRKAAPGGSPQPQQVALLAARADARAGQYRRQQCAAALLRPAGALSSSGKSVMSQLDSLIAGVRPLSEVFIDALRRSANASSAIVGMNRHDDDRDHADQQSLALEDEDAVGWQPDAVGTILPDQMLAAVILGHALDRNREAIATIARGGVVVIEAPSAALVAPLCRVLRRCLFDPAWTIKDGGSLRPADARGVALATLVLFDRDGTQSGHTADVGNTEVGIALQMRGPIVGLAADPDKILPSDLIRIADQRVELPPIDAEAISAVIAAVTGKPPTSIEPQ